jgi:hypothetical protein
MFSIKKREQIQRKERTNTKKRETDARTIYSCTSQMQGVAFSIKVNFTLWTS